MSMSEARQKYADIIDREHHVSKKRPQMDRLNRAAQFSPFAALTGYEDLIQESERVTDDRLELDENSKELLDKKLIRLLHQLPSPTAAFTYFVPDSKKAGGEYVTVTGRIAKYDEYYRRIFLDSGEILAMDDIISIRIDEIEER